jgi:hypothetical protein
LEGGGRGGAAAKGVDGWGEREWGFITPLTPAPPPWKLALAVALAVAVAVAVQ